MRRNDKTQLGARLLRRAAVLGLAMSAAVAAADPVYVVDTGPGAATGGRSLTASQFLAGQFTLDVGHEIQALEGWIIYPTLVGDLPIEAVLYGDAGGLPDLDDEVYRQLFAVPASGIPFSADWHGVEGFALSVDAGTYWLAFEVPTADFGSGAMPPTPLQELDAYAIDSGAGWIEDTSATGRIGIRVLPEPGLAPLLAVAGVALAIAGRYRSASARKR